MLAGQLPNHAAPTANSELRSREFLNPAEVDKLIEAAKANRVTAIPRGSWSAAGRVSDFRAGRPSRVAFPAVRHAVSIRTELVPV